MTGSEQEPRESVEPEAWQRPPFLPGNTVGRQAEPGNELSLHHGAYSPRKVDPLARELVDMQLADQAVDYLKAPAYRAELWAWARAEAQAQLLIEYIAKLGEASGDGVGDLGDDRTRAAYLLLHRVEARAASARTRLGLTPLARARLGKDVAQGRAADADVALRMAQLHELERQGWTPPPGWSDHDGSEDDDTGGGRS